jgi:DNA polymerase-1
MDYYLVDGNSYVYRAFFAIKGLTNSKGVPTNAVFGFTRMILKMIREKRPGGLAVSFDTPHPTERHEMFADYKAHRPETPQDLIEQMPLVKEVLGAMRISVFEKPGYEADDVLATLAALAAEKGHRAYIVSSDKDMLQLVGGPVCVYDPMKDRVLDEDYVIERFGVPPERVTEYMALVGDPADNIPGLKGVGDKTARELLGQFGSLDELMEHPERIRKDALRKKVSGGVEAIRLSKALAEIRRDVPIGFDERDFHIKEPDRDSLMRIFGELELSSLMGLIPDVPRQEGRYETVLDPDRLEEIAGLIVDDLPFATETTGKDPLRDRLVGFSVSWKEGRAAYVPLMHTYEDAPRQIDRHRAFETVRRLFEDESVSKTGHNLKFDILVLRAEGIDTRGMLYDTMIASYLLNPVRQDHSLQNTAMEYLLRKKKTFAEVAGKEGFGHVDLPSAADYAAEDAELARALRPVLFEKLAREGLEEVYFKMEMPLVHVLCDMQGVGMKIDAERLGELSRELELELESLRTRIYFLAGGEFNINSPRQLAKVLFEDLGLRPGKKKKTGYSTDMSVLEELAKTHDLPLEILNYRSLFKLKNTYADVLPRLANPKTGRLHTSFNQTATATGRLSSSQPNLQNIPVKGDWGRKIREAFTAEEGHVLVSADYSQIELRILAHLSGDEALVEAFNNDVDIHARTASEIFGVPSGKVSADMRRVAKTVNFGVLYGMTSFGLSETLDISRAEAEKYITQYFDRHPGVSAYIEHSLQEARRLGYVRTVSGRKRPVSELKSRNSNTRKLGERLVLNSPIQGTAADIIKTAMINISGRLKELGYKTRMILQVHDELLFEAPDEERDRTVELVRGLMQEAAGLSVPIKVDIGSGKNWAEAH